MNSIFNFKLNHAVQPGLVCVGKFDGKHHSLAFATSTGNVLIHNPHRAELFAASSDSSSRASDVQTLAVNRKVTALSSGCFSASASSASADRDLLLVGTETNLMAYDVDRNSDLFYKVCPIVRCAVRACEPIVVSIVCMSALFSTCRTCPMVCTR